MKGCEHDYLDLPDDPVALCNYALFLHCMHHNYERVRPLYMQAMRFMENRGPDNAFVLFAYAIFLAATFEDDMNSIDELAERARAANFVNPNIDDMRPIRFLLANAGYFRLATIVNQDGESWHNYALCRQIAFQDYEGAEEAYIKAVLAAPHDERIIKNFNLFLRRCRGEDPRTGIDAFEKMRLYQRNEAQRLEDEELAARHAMDNDPEVIAAATKLQLAWRNANFKSMLSAATNVTKRGQTINEEREKEARRALVAQGLANFVWEELTAEDGTIYFYNNETGESTWETPDENERSLVIMIDGAGSLPSDIEEWEICDNEDGTTFYYNVRTGASQWDTPRTMATGSASVVSKALLMAKKAQADEDAATLAITGSLEQGSFTEYTIESTSLSLPGDEWEECVDAEGRTFFYNDRTGESTWDDPRNNPSLMLMSGGGDGRDDDGGAMVLSSAGEWEEVVDADGAVYYYNSETGVTSWDRPDGLEGGGGGDGVGGMALGASWAGEEVVTDDGQKWEQADDGEGNFYWYNSETGVSSWDFPTS